MSDIRVSVTGLNCFVETDALIVVKDEMGPCSICRYDLTADSSQLQWEKVFSVTKLYFLLTYITCKQSVS